MKGSCQAVRNGRSGGRRRANRTGRVELLILEPIYSERTPSFFHFTSLHSKIRALSLSLSLVLCGIPVFSRRPPPITVPISNTHTNPLQQSPYPETTKYYYQILML